MIFACRSDLAGVFMKPRSVRLDLCALLLLGCAAWPAGAIVAESPKNDAPDGGPQGKVLLDNARVMVRQFILQPGQSTGRDSHAADQLLVFIKGGVLRSQATGRSTLWRDGRVVWQKAGDPADEGSTNTGATPIEMDLVTLKPRVQSAAADPGGKPKYQYLNYPDIPGEDLLDNDEVIVQRFTVNPGQWEGVHAHCPDMLFIHIKGGQWATKSYKEPEHPYPNPSLDGEVGWMPTIDISVGHQSGNIGKNPIDLIWVTLKK
jgi:predicted metal-dependent enzyme (double-stranded beta helix superfamily)